MTAERNVTLKMNREYPQCCQLFLKLDLMKPQNESLVKLKVSMEVRSNDLCYRKYRLLILVYLKKVENSAPFFPFMSWLNNPKGVATMQRRHISLKVTVNNIFRNTSKQFVFYSQGNGILCLLHVIFLVSV